MDLITDTYANKILGVIHCYDRIVITGTLPQLCYAQGMSSYLYYRNIRIFDYTQFAEPYRDRIWKNAGIHPTNYIFRVMDEGGSLLLKKR